MIVKNDNLEIKYLKEKNERLNNEYQKLLNFKNNINIKEEYTVTNVIHDNYGFDKLIINGTNYNLNDEVINEKGLIGYISKINKNNSEVTFLYNTASAVKINNKYGKISGHDSNSNLIIKDIDNVSINDLVYSVYGTYIGKVIDINYNSFTSNIIVKTIDYNNIDYCIVIGKNK